MRPNPSFKPILAWFSCLGLILFWGCSGEKAPETPDKPTVPKVTIEVAVANVHGDFNPHLYDADGFVQVFLYDSLVGQQNGQSVPALAESSEISKDGLEIVFRLRPGVKFSDGSPFDAHNVKKNFDAIMSHPEDYDWMGVVTSMEGYEVVNDLTFKVTFKVPYYAALQEFSSARPFRMLGEAAFMEDGSTVSGIKAPIGTGPWKLDQYESGQYAVFSKNPHYWGQSPKLDGFTLRIIPQGETAVSSLKAGEIDLIYDFFESELMNISSFEAFQKDENFKTFVSGPMFTRVMTINTTRPPLNNLIVRKAIALALDRENMVKNVFHETETVASSYFFSKIPYCDLGLKSYPYEPRMARALLDAAGWILPEGQSVRSKDGTPFEIGLYYDSTNVVHRAFAQIIQAQLGEVGIKVNLTGEESAAYLSRGKAGDFDLNFSVSWGEPYDPHSTLNGLATKSESLDYLGVAGLPNYDELAQKITDVLHETSEDLRQETYREILTAIHEGYGIVPLSYKTNRAAAQKNLEGVEFHFSYDLPLSNTVKR
ncbi:MAG: nickel ABC transporter substrate-binding protein [Deltaproteobacteria bacterium]|nr:nickel ABC transporter substrate-binding protein [Deltaproteobacteria bacterium]